MRGLIGVLEYLNIMGALGSDWSYGVIRLIGDFNNEIFLVAKMAEFSHYI